MAQGAERSTILRMVLGEGVAIPLVGLMAGGMAAIPLSESLERLLFGVEPADPPTIALSAVPLVASPSSRRGSPRGAPPWSIRSPHCAASEHAA